MSLIKRASYGVEKSSTRSEVGTGLLVAGGGGIGLLVLAGFLPFISLPMLCILLVVAGIALKL